MVCGAVVQSKRFAPVVWLGQYAPYHKMPEEVMPAEWMPVMTDDTAGRAGLGYMWQGTLL